MDLELGSGKKSRYSAGPARGRITVTDKLQQMRGNCWLDKLHLFGGGAFLPSDGVRRAVHTHIIDEAGMAETGHPREGPGPYKAGIRTNKSREKGAQHAKA